MWPKCDCCGRFARVEVGASFGMSYSGWPPTPDRELFKCKTCSDKWGPLKAPVGFAAHTAGVFTAEHLRSPELE